MKRVLPGRYGVSTLDLNFSFKSFAASRTWVISSWLKSWVLRKSFPLNAPTYFGIYMWGTSFKQQIDLS